MDLFSLIRAPNPTKVKTESRPHAPHELPLLTLTAPRVIEMDEPAAATDSSGVPSAIERSPLDFAYEAEASGRETAAPEMPSPEESRKRGHEGIDANAPPKSLRRDHADLRPSGVPADISDPDPLAFTEAPSSPPADVTQSSQGVAVARDPVSENVSSPVKDGSPGSVYRPEWGVTNGSLLDTPEGCQDLVDHAAPPGYFSELRHMHNEDFLRQYNINLDRQVAMGSQLRLRQRRVDVLQQQVSEEETLKAAFEDYKRQQEFADVVSARIAIGMSEDLKHGHAQRTVESLEAFDPEAEAKFAAALQSLKDLKLPLLDQLEGLKDAPMDLSILVYPEVRDPRNPWACKEEIQLANAIAANISRAEQKKRSHIVCRTHGVGSAHHARSDRVPVSIPIVVPQGLALLLVDVATQTESDDA
nr:hypothetical protein [Tanacetum cinerariifolium]